MKRVYYIQNKRTKEVLNQKGGWSGGLTSYRLAEFETEEAAIAAFPTGVDCTVAVRTKKETDK